MKGECSGASVQIAQQIPGTGAVRGRAHTPRLSVRMTPRDAARHMGLQSFIDVTLMQPRHKSLSHDLTPAASRWLHRASACVPAVQKFRLGHPRTFIVSV